MLPGLYEKGFFELDRISLVKGKYNLKTKNLSIMKKGQQVSMSLSQDGFLDGITIEDECNSPTKNDPDRKVIRIRWEDGTETTENINDLF